MKVQEEINFNRIAEAIHYITTNFKNQPGLEEVAEKVNLSPFHFQRLFSEWAGTSPKRFLQYISIGYAKQLLRENQSLFDTAMETGLSGTSRLHDLFVSIEGMTPGEYKNGGENLHINYSLPKPLLVMLLQPQLKKEFVIWLFMRMKPQPLKIYKYNFLQLIMSRLWIQPNKTHYLFSITTGAKSSR